MLQQAAQWIGYLATLLLAISLLVNNDVKFRWLNLSGCVAFIIYGAVLNALPVVLTNVLLFGINAWFLVQIYRRHELFEIYEFKKGGVIVDRFLEFYEKDILLYFPEYKRELLEGNLNFVVLRDLVIANAFSTKLSDDGTAEVFLNYTTSKYRDYKVGRFIFEKEKQFLLSKGISKIYYPKLANLHHKKFLLKIGFQKEIINGKECLTKNLIA